MTKRLSTLVWLVLKLNTGELYDLQRIVGRLASDKRLSDPIWQQNYRMGLHVAGFRDRG